MTNPWLKHVKQYHANYPRLSYKEALQKSKASYHPMQTGRGPAASKVHPEKRSTIANLTTIFNGTRPDDPNGAHLNANLVLVSRLNKAFPEMERYGAFDNKIRVNPPFIYPGDLVAPSRRATEPPGEMRFQPTTGWRQFLPSKPTPVLTIPTQYPHGIDLNNLRTLDVRSERKK